MFVNGTLITFYKSESIPTCLINATLALTPSVFTLHLKYHSRRYLGRVNHMQVKNEEKNTSGDAMKSIKLETLY